MPNVLHSLLSVNFSQKRDDQPNFIFSKGEQKSLFTALMIFDAKLSDKRWRILCNEFGILLPRQILLISISSTSKIILVGKKKLNILVLFTAIS